MIPILGKTGVGKSKITEFCSEIFKDEKLDISSGSVESKTDEYKIYTFEIAEEICNVIDTVGLMDSKDDGSDVKDLLKLIRFLEDSKIGKIVLTYGERLSAPEDKWFKRMIEIFGMQNVVFVRNKSESDNDTNTTAMKLVYGDDIQHYTIPMFLTRYPQSIAEAKDAVKDIFEKIANSTPTQIKLKIPHYLMKDKIIEGETVEEVKETKQPITKTEEYDATEWKEEKYSVPVTEEYEEEVPDFQIAFITISNKKVRRQRTVLRELSRQIPYTVRKTRTLTGVKVIRRKIIYQNRYKERLDGIKVFFDKILVSDTAFYEQDIY